MAQRWNCQLLLWVAVRSCSQFTRSAFHSLLQHILLFDTAGSRIRQGQEMDKTSGCVFKRHVVCAHQSIVPLGVGCDGHEGQDSCCVRFHGRQSWPHTRFILILFGAGAFGQEKDTIWHIRLEEADAQGYTKTGKHVRLRCLCLYVCRALVKTVYI